MVISPSRFAPSMSRCVRSGPSYSARSVAVTPGLGDKGVDPQPDATRARATTNSLLTITSTLGPPKGGSPTPDPGSRIPHPGSLWHRLRYARRRQLGLFGLVRFLHPR